MNNITMMELKLTFLILCEMEVVNSYHSIMESHFEIVKDFNRCITKHRFEEFVNIFGKILSYLGEPLYFESKVTADILNEAFQHSPGMRITQDIFYGLWMSHQSSNFSTYTNLFLLIIRFKKAESIIHQNDCSGCRKFPIVGLRYKCQKCKISLCFECFSKGYTSSRHSLSHRFYELATTEKERHGTIFALLGKFLSIFRHQQTNGTINPKFDHESTKLIEDEHIELVQVDDDMDVGVSRRIRSEVYNNSENLMIQQRDLVDKLLESVERLKIESENFKTNFVDKQKDLEPHADFLDKQVEIFSKIHEDLAGTFNRNQSNNTIRPFSSPSKSIFLPSSTPYMTKEKSKNDKMLSRSGKNLKLLWLSYLVEGPNSGNLKVPKENK